MGNSKKEVIIMELLKRLQNWYQSHCDGDWEHSYGVTIDTLDNPGWRVSVDLTDTLLENVQFKSVKTGDSESKNDFWIDCRKLDETYIGMGSADSLETLLTIFLDWAEANSDTSAWDGIVNTMIEQCKYSSDLEELRQLYTNIDSIPNEHIRKKELIKLFNEKWAMLIDNI
jgi:hypothetical protein